MGARRDAYELAGYGPGDAYTGVWDGITEIRRSLREQRSTRALMARNNVATLRRAALVEAE
jgi:hypothetical protein